MLKEMRTGVGVVLVADVRWLIISNHHVYHLVSTISFHTFFMHVIKCGPMQEVSRLLRRHGWVSCPWVSPLSR